VKKPLPHAPARPAANERVYGLAAARAAFMARPEAVLSIAHTSSVRLPLADMLKTAARRRVAYREVEADELTRIAQSVHHEGVCMLVKPRPTPTPADLIAATQPHGLLVVLDGVQNPHNIGAILRSAAYFGAKGLVACTQPQPAQAPSPPPSAAASPPLSAAARRVAEGGAELVPFLALPEPQLKNFLADAQRAGIAVVGSDARADRTLTEFAWPARALLVLGHEQHGLSPAVRARCQHSVRIAGSERVDSLNVSVAAGVFFASYAAKHGGLHG